MFSNNCGRVLTNYLSDSVQHIVNILIADNRQKMTEKNRLVNNVLWSVVANRTRKGRGRGPDAARGCQLDNSILTHICYVKWT